ncbi:hypothetical protein OAV21_02750 [bacterium]|jgi:hypothetical protein|nr:hypothetical protein [bacterium]
MIPNPSERIFSQEHCRPINIFAAFRQTLKRRYQRPLLALACALFMQPQALLGVEVVQTLSLNSGWNAVWLEVSPEDDQGNPLLIQDALASTDFVIDKIARRSLGAGPANFVDDPNALSNSYNSDSWEIWSRNPESGEGAVISARGNHAYMVHVVAVEGKTNGDPAGTISVRGKVDFTRLSWLKGSYNLVGFGVEGQPTFDSLLGAAGVLVNDLSVAPAQPTVLKLESATGHWITVSGGDPVESGRAYWINAPFDLISNTYSCPVAIDFFGTTTGRLNFGDGPGDLKIENFPGEEPSPVLVLRRELTFSNLDDTTAHSVEIEQIPPLPGEPDQTGLQILPIQPIPNELAWRAIPGASLQPAWEAVTLAANTSQTVSLGALPRWTTGEKSREQLLKVTVQLGGGDGGSAYYYMPAVASNPDLPNSDDPSPDPLTAPDASIGLWSGQIVIDQVTSLTEDGRPVTPTTSKPAMTILIHVDDSKNVSLLSHVMIMQTKTADPEATPEFVLVVDEKQIPQFEGIQQREGKRVGYRLETPFFAMPRDLAGQPASFKEEVTDAAEPGSPTDEESEIYIDTRKQRPTELAEIYLLSLPLDGQLEAGNTLRTMPPSHLRVDPFHRSNPFRHVYHPQLGTGYSITRELFISFDDGPGMGFLTGTYQETTKGLAVPDIVSRGKISLRRVTEVGQLIE